MCVCVCVCVHTKCASFVTCAAMQAIDYNYMTACACMYIYSGPDLPYTLETGSHSQSILVGFISKGFLHVFRYIRVYTNTICVCNVCDTHLYNGFIFCIHKMLIILIISLL